MKIYIIEYNNGGMYEDYYSWVGEAFKTYRGASEYLIDKGFDVYYTYSIKGDRELYFHAECNDEHSEETAHIVEVDYLDK
ncbi:hypothetical protein [Priestia flexa]|uniref:hypothetical protein n=1 Tax=Priestia flexa TaxID=86664 RepID=UPI000473EB2E|nr:hypothetical protein [Priestia flexa]